VGSKLVSLVGLTASGKSAIGIKLAKEFNGEIVSCDSRQVYRGLDIGTAKVTAREMDGVVHHMLDVCDAGGHFDVYMFQSMAFRAIDDILMRGKLPILVGGTGLYSRSIVENYDFGGTGAESAPKYDVLQICLLPPKEYILPRVRERIETRFDNGMIEETRGLLARGVPRDWLRGLGLEYFWNIEFIEGAVTRDEYIKHLTTKTMQFAKRQRTWFKREKNTVFLIEPNDFENAAVSRVRQFV
jgi:tRNA dimethylallyltransferase